MHMTAACVYTHNKCRCKLGEVKKGLSLLSDFFSPMIGNIVKAKPRVQYVLMVLDIAETNQEWKTEATWTYGTLNNQTLKLTAACCKPSVRMQWQDAVLMKNLKIALPHQLTFLIRFFKNYNTKVHSQVIFVTCLQENLSQYGFQNHVYSCLVLVSKNSLAIRQEYNDYSVMTIQLTS